MQMLCQHSLVLLVIPLSRLPQFVNFFINTTSIIVTDNLTQLIHFLDRLH